MARIEAIFEQKAGLPLLRKVKRSRSASWEIAAQAKKYTLGPNFGIAEVSSFDGLIHVSISDKQKWIKVRPKLKTKLGQEVKLDSPGDKITLEDSRNKQSLTLTWFD